MTRFLTLAALLLTVGVLSACNTVQGVGRDIEAGGEALGNAASKTKRY